MAGGGFLLHRYHWWLKGWNHQAKVHSPDSPRPPKTSEKKTQTWHCWKRKKHTSPLSKQNTLKPWQVLVVVFLMPLHCIFRSATGTVEALPLPLALRFLASGPGHQGTTNYQVVVVTGMVTNGQQNSNKNNPVFQWLRRGFLLSKKDSTHSIRSRSTSRKDMQWCDSPLDFNQPK